MLKILISYFILISCIWMNNLFSSEKLSPLLIINMDNETVLPRNFRTSQDPFKLEFKDQLPSREGLDSLHLSGSSQFSEKALEVIFKQLKCPLNFYILDLRQECHGFINGSAVSWYGVKNWENVNKNLTDIEDDESTLLHRALNQKNIILSRIVAKDETGQKLPDAVSIPSTVHSIATENQLVKSHQFNYCRLPVTDHARPTNETVDYFVNFTRQLPSNHWLHIHCAGGAGRTTTFMSMYDMMKNAKKASFDDILKRQWMIGGNNLKKTPTNSIWKKTLSSNRLQFLQDFYDYCRTNEDGFSTNWSNYLKNKN